MRRMNSHGFTLIEALIALWILSLGLLGASLIVDAWLAGGFVSTPAEAVIGRPATPGSVAGVARRTTRRMIRRSTIYVASLPPACTTVLVNGATLHYCGATYYQPYGTQYVVVYVN